MEKFVPGQRWASEMEPELGIGIVDAVEGRRVRLRFPDSGLVRLYAAHSAPLQRVAFQPGDRVMDDASNAFTVDAVETDGGLLIYCDGDRRLPEDRLGGALTLDTPKQRIMAGQRDVASLFDLRRQILSRRCNLAASPIEGLIGGRVDLIPHQFAIAREVSGRLLPRVMLADETGLGKTIEAGLILHRLLATGRIGRILVIVPDALVVQWYVELARRFNLRFRLFDSQWVSSLTGEAGNNPFADEPFGLCGVSFLAAASEKMSKHLLDGQYDMLVVDEAHHLKPNEPLFKHIDRLARSIPRLILITATPGHPHAFEHFSRLRLLDSRRFSDFDRFKEESPSLEQMMFKTTRPMVGGFPGRDVVMLPLEGSVDGEILTREVLEDFGLASPSPKPIFTNDPRVAWLETQLRAHRNHKILLICRTAEKVEALHEELLRRINAKIGRYHDRMTLIQRDRNAAWFADPQGATLLLCSEIGSEGRNFQFARHLVLFDLPDDADLLEQRIGRLDRIGQTGVVKVMVPFVPGTAGEILARWYDEALNVLGSSVPVAGWVMRRLRKPLSELLRNPGENARGPRLERLIRCARLAAARQQQLIEEKQDLLRTHKALTGEPDNRLLERIGEMDSDPAFPAFAEALLDAWGIVMESITPGVYELKPDNRYAEPLPGFRPSGLSATTRRDLALAREDLDFLTHDHPLITGAMENFLGAGKGNSAFAVLPTGKENKILLEMLFVIEATGLADPAMRRFLPPMPLRVVVDHEGEKAGKWLPEKALYGVKEGPAELWSALLPSISRLIPQLVDLGREMAREKAEPLIVTAGKTARQTLTKTLDQLKTLEQANPGTFTRDIEVTRKQRDGVLTAIASASVRLDGLRVIVVGEQ